DALARDLQRAGAFAVAADRAGSDHPADGLPRDIDLLAHGAVRQPRPARPAQRDDLVLPVRLRGVDGRRDLPDPGDEPPARGRGPNLSRAASEGPLGDRQVAEPGESIARKPGGAVNTLPSSNVSPGRPLLPGVTPCQDPANIAPTPLSVSIASRICPSP